jgi:acetyltransferase
VDPANRHYLTPLFEPRSVAIVGATEQAGKIGQVLVANMLEAGYRGRLHGVNPKYRSVQGVPCVARIAALPEAVDLVVIATPAPTVPELIDECGKRGIRAALVITAGFGETGREGKLLEARVLANARKHGVRMIGPNCLGMLRPDIGLNAAFSRGGALPGTLALVAQSGAVCTAMLDWARPNKVGFSSIVSLGGSTDVDFGEIIDYLACDIRTQQILLYIEGIRDARRFISSVRAAARAKPVILMKVGRHPAGSRAAVSHTGAMVGMDDVFDAAVRRAGAVRVQSIGELVASAQALSDHVHPAGERLAIVTNGGGPGVMAADRAGDVGVPLATLSPGTIATLQSALPDNWSHGNPVDLIGDAGSDRYRAALAACLADEGVDGVLVMLAPQAMTEAVEAARVVVDTSRGAKKPVIACWMGEESVAEGRALLAGAGIPVFRRPESAVDMFARVSAFYRNQRGLLQVTPPRAELAPPDVARARSIVEAVLAAGREVLSEGEAKELLAAFHIPVARVIPAANENDAMAAAQSLGFPVAMKILSPDITHKTEVGGVRLGVRDIGDVREAFAALVSNAQRAKPEARIEGVVVEPMIEKPNGRELMVGVLRDPVFGPAISFGMGGVAVEVHRDRAIALPPLNAPIAEETIRATRVSKMLGAFRNLPPANMRALVEVLLRVSELVCELPEIEELDINPLSADENDAVAVDARVRVVRRDSGMTRYAHMAIHPYPTGLGRELHLPDGTRLTARPIRPEDSQLELEFVNGLSEASRYFRFMNAMRELTPSMLARFTQIDYDREMAFVVLTAEPGRERQIAVARYSATPDARGCEYAIVVADDWQGRGLGRALMDMLIDTARERGFAEMIGYVLAVNHAMLRLCERLGFRVGEDADDPQVKRVVLAL